MARQYRWCVALLAGLVAACRDVPDQVRLGTSEFRIVRQFTSDVIDRVRDLHVDSAGTIWVLSSSPPYLAAFDHVGTLRHSGGVRGEGPSDFLYPFLVVPPSGMRGETVGIVDLGRHQLLDVDTLSQPVRAHDLRLIGGEMRADMPELVPSLPFAVDRIGTTVLAVTVPGAISTEVDFARQQLVRLVHGHATSLLSITGSRDVSYRWLRTHAVWAACHGRGLVGIDTAHRFLLRARPSGQLDSARLPPLAPRLPLTPAALRRNLRHHLALEYREGGKQVSASFLDATINQVARRYPLSAADSLPRFSAVLCANDGSAWLRHFDLDASPVGASQRWWRQVPKGWERVILPGGFRPFRVVGEQVTGIFTDSTGLEHVAIAAPWR